MPREIHLTPYISVEPGEIKEEFFLAGGPGGQNVNKVATGVRLRFDVLHSTSLPEEVKTRLLHLAGKKMTAQGELIIEVRQYRTQEKNRKAALARLEALVSAAARRPKARQATKPTIASQQRRLAQKKRHSQVKHLRRADSIDE